MSNNIKDVNDITFEQEVISSAGPVLVDFWASWCGPCRALAPILEEVAMSYAGKVKFLKMDVENSQATPAKYSIRSIPTLILFKDGKIISTRVGGDLSKSQLSKFLDEHV